MNDLLFGIQMSMLCFMAATPKIEVVLPGPVIISQIRLMTHIHSVFSDVGL